MNDAGRAFWSHLVEALVAQAMVERRPGWQILADYVCHQVGETFEYHPCTCDAYPFPHRPGGGRCKMPKELAREINLLRIRPPRYEPCTCDAYPFPHRPGSGKCPGKRETAPDA